MLSDDSFGAQLFTFFLRNSPHLPAGLAPENAIEVNESRLGDRIYFYRDTQSDAVIVLWRLRLGDASLREILEAYFQGGGSEPKSARMLDNGDILLAAGSTSETAEALEVAANSAASGETMSQKDLAAREAALPPLPVPIRLR